MANLLDEFLINYLCTFCPAKTFEFEKLSRNHVDGKPVWTRIFVQVKIAIPYLMYWVATNLY